MGRHGYHTNSSITCCVLAKSPHMAKICRLNSPGPLYLACMWIYDFIVSNYKARLLPIKNATPLSWCHWDWDSKEQKFKTLWSLYKSKISFYYPRLPHWSTMSIYAGLCPFTSPPQTNQRISRVILTPKTPTISLPPKPTNLLTITAIHGKPRWENLLNTAKPRTLPIIRAVNGNSEHSPVAPAKPSWENFLATAASLYPLYVIVGWFVACVKPSTFAWFVSRGPASYSVTLGLIMLAMGLTLEFKDMIRLFLQRPLSVSFDLCSKCL